MKVSVELYEPDIFCICETHLTTLVDDAELFIAGYRFFRNDRDFRPGKDSQDVASAERCVDPDPGKCVSPDISGGGGCIIYYKEHLNPDLVDSFKVGDCLALKIECDIGNVIIACVYRSPSLSQAQNKHLLGKIKRLSLDCADEELVLVGDLNLADVCWVTGTVSGPTATKNRVLNLQHEYIDLITDLGLSWHITDEITRRRVVSGVLQESTLDQVVSSNEAIVNCVKVLAPLGKSDHVSLLVDLNVNSKHKREFTRSTKILWGKVTEADILDFSKDVNWSSSAADLDVESLWKELHSKLLGVKSKVPSCHVDSKRSRKVPWDDSCLKRFRRDKDKFWALFDKEATHYNLNLALCKQGKYEEKETLAKIRYEKKITANLKNCTKPFFSYLRSKRKVNTTVTSLVREDGSETKGAGEAASELSAFFSSVFEQECYGPLKKECYDKVSGYSENPSNELYTIHGDILETIESEKDLGLVVSSNFKWDEQIKSSIAKANKTIAWVSRNIICKDQGVMLLIYKSLVRPHLEYAVQCWAPSPRFGNWSIILELEKVQRKFTRLINDIGTLTYGERLKSLTLTTLAERRMRGDLIEAFKIIRGFVDYGQNLFKLSISGLNILSKITKDTNSDRRDFFSERILKYWNILPKSVKMSESVNSFKANLENYKVRSLANVFHNSTGHFWEVSGHIMDRIETPSYLAGRPAFREYLDSNPWIARRKKINTFQSQ